MATRPLTKKQQDELSAIYNQLGAALVTCRWGMADKDHRQYRTAHGEIIKARDRLSRFMSRYSSHLMVVKP